MLLSLFQKELSLFDSLKKGDYNEALHLLNNGEAPYYQNKYGVSLETIAPFLALAEECESIPVIRRNQSDLSYISPSEFESHFHVVYRSKPRFESYSILEKVIVRTAKLLKKQYLSSMNGWTKALIEKQIRTTQISKGAIKYMDSEIGYGVFALEAIPQYTYFGEYSGVVRRRTRSKDQFNNYIFAYTATTYSTPYVIDARQEGGITRFINHSENPNLISRWIVIDGITRIIFFTKRAIRKGQQLTYDYGNDYWRTRRFPKVL